ncbi:hypothetical protein [Corynebacterium sp. NML130628]|uniref:hypothetical protein n=1 Tax=Corynebacterium sp. NML130628 TaxID=1906333 RepID=UPI0008FB8DDE|nr:hypothetical protein [Corynebacterium sp. NML130628]OIR45753.1 hypothetical protein BJP07_02485 [Corynebacterium sp. NML130628]
MDVDAFPHVTEIVDVLAGEDWLLVGGAMTLLHCAIQNVEYARPTVDVDIVVDPVHGSTLFKVAELLEKRGYRKREPLRKDGYLHQFTRPDGFSVDVMGKDSSRTPQRWFGQRVVECPGSKSALGNLHNGDWKEVVQVNLGGGRIVRIPNVWSALALKGWALKLPSPNRERHVQDCLALFACAAKTNPKRALTKSEREAVNFVLSQSYLGDLNNWTPLKQSHQLEALAEIRRLRPQGDIGVPVLLKPLLPESM